MFFIQCTLVVIAIMIAAGIYVGISMAVRYFDSALRNQASTYRLLYDFRHDLLGEYSDGMLFNVARDLKSVAELARDAKRGRIPNLRYDDWYATEEDLERWERAERNAAYL